MLADCDAPPSTCAINPAAPTPRTTAAHAQRRGARRWIIAAPNVGINATLSRRRSSIASEIAGNSPTTSTSLLWTIS